MQALEFTRAVQEIVTQLKVSELLELAERWVQPNSNHQISEVDKNQFISLVLASNAGYVQLMSRDATQKILKEFGVAGFYDPPRLRGIMNTLNTVTQSGQILQSWQSFAYFFSFMELLKSFLRMKIACEKLLKDEKIGQLSPSQGIVELEFVEYTNETGISPTRLSVFVAVVRDLHTKLALVCDLKQDQMTFQYFDSGSRFLAGAKCAKEIADLMNTLLSLWDRVWFWRHEKHSKNLSSLFETLAFNEKVQQQVEKQALTAEEGENLKIRVFRDVEKLTGIGVTTPLRGDLTVNRQQMLTEMRNTKLLTTGDNNEANDENQSPEPTSPRK